MKRYFPAAAAAMLTALLSVPANADHRRFGGFFVEPFFVEPFFAPAPQRPYRSQSRTQEGYPVSLVRRRLGGIGFSDIGRFDVYANSYSVTATDPGGVRVRLVIDRWTGDIRRARFIGAGPGVRPARPPALVERARPAPRRVAVLRVPPLPRPAPERAVPTAAIAPVMDDDPAPEKIKPEAERDEAIVTSSIDRVNSPEKAEAEPETGGSGQPDAAALPVPGDGSEDQLSPADKPVEVAAAPDTPEMAVAEGSADAAAPARSWPVTALQGERFDPADEREPLADY